MDVERVLHHGTSSGPHGPTHDACRQTTMERVEELQCFSHVHVGITNFERSYAFYSVIMNELGFELKFCRPDQSVTPLGCLLPQALPSELKIDGWPAGTIKLPFRKSLCYRGPRMGNRDPNLWPIISHRLRM